MQKITVLDTTLRDGAQSEDITYSVEDKASIIQVLDGFGLDYIEIGHPAANPKDLVVFESLRHVRLKTARAAVFGTTRKAHAAVHSDPQVQMLVQSGAPVAVISGKSWDTHILAAKGCTLAENLAMIRDTVSFCKARKLEVIFNAQHFFDGATANISYAMSALQAAVEGGADIITLCDTNGNTFPNDISKICAQVKLLVEVPLGIHTHNDCGLAVANAIAAVQAGITHVQGTFNGTGARCGNADLAILLPNLQLRMGYDCIPAAQLPRITSVCHHIAEVSNITIPNRTPYVGSAAFANKANAHLEGAEHLTTKVAPVSSDMVGNVSYLLRTETAGRALVLGKIREIFPDFSKDSTQLQYITQMIKHMEFEGYQFEAATASFSLVVQKILGTYRPLFDLVYYKIMEEQPNIGDKPANAILKIRVGHRQELTASEGVGPVNALENALRLALEISYPAVKKARLIDYKVRFIDANSGTSARVRVLLTATDGQNVWTTAGVSQDIIEASWIAMADSFGYYLFEAEKSAAGGAE